LVVESWGNYYVLAFHFQMKEGARSSCEHEWEDGLGFLEE
jgi:hypothetical protein